MPVTVIVGGQYGSEGKGKTTAHLVRERGYESAVRCGGPNSGHTVTINGKQIVLQQVPAGVVNDDCRLYMAAGCLIDKEVLLEEINMFGLDPDRLVIDRHAVVIQDEYINREKERALDSRIGSTCTGTGEAVAERAKRSKNIILAGDDKDLSRFCQNTAKRLQQEKQEGRKIVIEGTQGFGLSVYHSPYYPKATSRDTTVPGFLSEVGLGHQVDNVIMVIRTYPIRVPGDSGPFGGAELTWEEIKRMSGYPHEIKEFTSVTGGERRIAEFDINVVKLAARYNEPTEVAFMGMDYLNYENFDAARYDELDESATSLIRRVESTINTEVGLIGIGPTDEHLIDMRKYDVADNANRAEINTGG